MSRAAFHQAEIERILRAARKTNCVVQIDLKTMVVTITPQTDSDPKFGIAYAPDGKENWSDPPTRRKKGASGILFREEKAIQNILLMAEKQRLEKAKRRKQLRDRNKSGK